VTFVDTGGRSSNRKGRFGWDSPPYTYGLEVHVLPELRDDYGLVEGYEESGKGRRQVRSQAIWVAVLYCMCIPYSW
jgi:hypothetical protein